jgi:opacity protein-like surface antigen
MKKTLLPIAFLAICQSSLVAGDRFFASVGAGALFPGDSRFAERYGKVQVSPEVKVGYNFHRHFYLCLGYAFIAAKGRVPILGDEVKASQNYVTVGAGWEARSGRLQADLSAALLLAACREKGMDETFSRSAFGFEVGTGLRYFLRKRLFLGMSVSYAGAWATASFAGKETDITLGGLRLGGLLGLRF